MKKNFNDSMEQARKTSKRNFEQIKNQMIAEKRDLATKLHDQNSKQSSALREAHSDSMERMMASYEKRIAELELQNKTIQQNSNDTVREVMRKTAQEVQRQRETAKKSALNEIEAEKSLSRAKINQLQTKITKLESSYSNKINEQSLRAKQKLKDQHFELSNQLTSESKRYQEIIEQNNKFFARELQRMKMASQADRDRLVTQYENRIAQLKTAYADRIGKMEVADKVG